jgi:hypothetical protein
MEFLNQVTPWLPVLNLLLIPAIRAVMKISKRLDEIEFNQRRVCEKISLNYIEVKGK